MIGGFVYEGRRWPRLSGRYLFGDFGSRKLWALRRDGEAWSSELLAVADDHILAFGRDAEKELYVLAGDGVYRLESAAGRELPPPRLSQTGLFSRMATQEPAPGVRPYEVNAPLWSDGAGKRRYLALPEDGRVRFRADGAWELPDGTVLVKSFHLGERIVETRLLIKRTGHPGWDGYSYKWNQDRDRGLPPRGGRDRRVRGLRGGGGRHSRPLLPVARSVRRLPHTGLGVRPRPAHRDR